MNFNNPVDYDTYDHYDVYFQSDYDRYTRDYEAYEHFVALCEQEAGGSSSDPKRRRTYIPRERETAEQRLLEDYHVLLRTVAGTGDETVNGDGDGDYEKRLFL
nr:hypothetical protein [Tanacetum cinerariifolium]